MSREQPTDQDSGLGGEAEQLIEAGTTSQERRIGSQDSYSNAQEPPEKDALDIPVSQKQASDICNEIVSDWRKLGMQLDLKATELDAIDLDHHQVHNKASAVMCKWQQKNGREATLRVLVSALLAIGRNDLSEILLGNRKILHLIPEIPRSGAPTDTIFCKDLLTGEDYMVTKVEGGKQEPVGDESESATCLEKSNRKFQSVISSGRTVEPAQESQEETSTEKNMVLKLNLFIQRLEMQKEEEKQKNEKLIRELKAIVASGPQGIGYSPSKGTYDETTDSSSPDSNLDPAEDTRL